MNEKLADQASNDCTSGASPLEDFAMPLALGPSSPSQIAMRRIAEFHPVFYPAWCWLLRSPWQTKSARVANTERFLFKTAKRFLRMAAVFLECCPSPLRGIAMVERH